MNNYAKSLERGIDALLVIKTTPIATARDIQKQVMPNETIRTVQRFLNGLCEIGLIYGSPKEGEATRYYLSGKSLQLFGLCNDK